MHIAGICRFSLVGPGDWKAFRKQPISEIEAIALKQAEKLFTPARMEHRLSTLEHITLASMRAQTDQDFHFVVLASELMPQEYRTRLTAICAAVPQVTLRFFPIVGAGTAQKAVFDELGLAYRETLQFRLDDDDALTANYIEKMRRYCAPLAASRLDFAATFHTVTVVNSADGTGYRRQLPFMSAGAAMLHRKQTIFAIGHFALFRRFASVNIPSCQSLILKHETNDSTARSNMQRVTVLDRDEMRAHIDAHFPFIAESGLREIGHG